MNMVTLADLSIYLYAKSFNPNDGVSRFIISNFHVSAAENLMFRKNKVNRGDKCFRFTYFGGRGLI